MVAAAAGSTLVAGSSPAVGVEMPVVVPSLVAGAAEGWAGIAAAGASPVVGAETVEVVEVAVPIPVAVGIEVAVGAVEAAVDIGSIPAGVAGRPLAFWRLRPILGRHGRGGHCECVAIYIGRPIRPAQQG